MKYSLDHLKWAFELKRCQSDFIYTASTYFHIKSKHVIGFPTLKLNSVQEIMWTKIQAQLKRQGYVRQIVGKARQLGLSTICLAFNFWNVAFRGNRNALLITHDEPTSYEMFTVDQTIYQTLPPALKPALKYDSKFKMEFEALNSKILVGHARNMNVGASQMNHLVHLTEVARYVNADEVQSSLFPSISHAKGDDYSSVIMESTSQIGGNWFKDFAEAAMRGENEFEFTFIPWFMHTDYAIPVDRNFRLNAEEKELMRQYSLTVNQIAWRRLTRANYINPALFNQDFPTDWASSWVLPSGALRTFIEEDLTNYEDQLRPGTRAMPTAQGLDPHLGGILEVWEIPQPGVYYHLGVDPSEGRTEKADYTGICVVRGDTLRQVAEAKFHFDPADRDFHDFIYWLAMAYNTATIIPDITGGWGHALLTELQRRSYPNLWQWRRRDDLREKVTPRIGFLYSKRDKITLVNTGVMVVRQQRCVIHSSGLMQEMRSFLQMGVDEWGAAPSCKDDLVNAWLLAVLSAQDARSGLIPQTGATEEQRQGVYGATAHDIDLDMGVGAARGALNLSSWS